VFDPDRGSFSQKWDAPSSVEKDHSTGFILTDKAMLGFGLTSEFQMHYSETINLEGLIDVDNFENAWVVIEHIFPTNLIGRLKVPINTFYMKEPTTYAVSVYNSNLRSQADYVNKSIATWVLQTKIPLAGSGGDPGAPGSECLLDTFGGEPCSLKYERMGEWAKPGVE
jgi:hypothetical protein